MIFVHPHPQLKEDLEHCPYLSTKSLQAPSLFLLSVFIHDSQAFWTYEEVKSATEPLLQDQTYWNDFL